MRGKINSKGYLILSIFLISIVLTPFIMVLTSNVTNVNYNDNYNDISLESNYAWEEINEIGNYEETSDDTRSVQVLGNIAYVTDKYLGFLKLDISDPNKIIKLGSFDDDLNAASDGYEIEVQNGLAYIADGHDGLEIVNVTTMQRVGNYYSADGETKGVDVVGNIAYIADGTNGLEIIDVEDPTNPTKLGNYSIPVTGNAYGIQVVGSVAFLSTIFEGLHIINITNSITPIKISNLTDKVVQTYPWVTQVVGDYAFCVFNQFGGLGIINVTDLTNPTLVSQVDTSSTGSWGYSISVENNVAILSTSNGLILYNVTDVNNPHEIEYFDDGIGQTYNTHILGNLIYCAMGSRGLRIFEVYNSTFDQWTQIGLLGQYISTYSNILSIEVVGNIAFLAGSTHTLEIVNISDVYNPTYISHVNISESTYYTGYDVDVEGDLAYVAFRRGGVAIFNVSDLSNPINTANITLTSNSTVKVIAQGELVYITDQYPSRALSIFNCSDPYNPSQVYSGSISGTVYALAMDGQYAYIGINTGIRIYNVTDPLAPDSVEDIIGGLGIVYDVKVDGSILYVVSGTGLLSIWNVTYPENPVSLGNFTYPHPLISVAYTNAVVLLGTQLGGIISINASDPTSLTMMGYYNYSTGLTCEDLHVEGQYAYGACSFRGLMIFEGFAPKIRDILPGDNSYSANSTSNIIIWSNLTDNIESGNYTVYRNNTVHATGSWTHGGNIQVTVDTNAGLGAHNYTLQFNDSAGIDGQSDTVWITITDDSNPFVEDVEINPTYVANGTGTVNWTLGDNVAAGYYRVWINDSVRTGYGWTPWVNNSKIEVPVDTDLGLGTWNYTIEYNDSVGNPGPINTVLVNITDQDIPTISGINNPSPVDANSTGAVNDLWWTLNDNAAGGYRRIWRNNSIISDWTQWNRGENQVINVPSNDGLGIWNFTIEFNDSQGNPGPTNTQMVTVQDVNVPWALTSGNATIPANTSSQFFNVWLYDDIAEGYFTAYRNNTPLYIDFLWNNGSQNNIGIETNIGLGEYNYTIVFNDSWGLVNKTTVWITIADLTDPFADNLEVAGPYSANSTGSQIKWTLGDKIGSGYYRVLVDGSVHPDHPWTAWSNATEINVDILTNIGLGAFNYSIEFNDTYGNTNLNYTWLNIIDDTNPFVDSNTGPAMYAANATSQTVNWTLGDNAAGGYYWILVDGIQRVDPSIWINNTNLIVPVFTNIGLGLFNYSIYYNDSQGNPGASDTIWITIEDQTAPTSSIPSNASYVQNSTGQVITWTLNDNAAGGFYRVFRNGSEIQGWTAWTRGSVYNIPINTDIGLGMFNYTIFFNDTAGIERNDTVWITITAYVPPTGPTGPIGIEGMIILVVILCIVGGTVVGLYVLHVKGIIDLGRLKPSSGGSKSGTPKDTKPAKLAKPTKPAKQAQKP